MWKALVEVLDLLSQLTYLDLSGVNPSREALGKLWQGDQPIVNLKVLKLGKVNSPVECDANGQDPVLSRLFGLPHLRRLQELDLSACELVDTGVNSLVGYLESPRPKLQVLRIA